MLLFCSSNDPKDEAEHGHLNGDADGCGASRGITNVLILTIVAIVGVLVGVDLLVRLG